ncbi:MAG: hypothetical protein ACTSR8_12860 [Promethearchaeota archaeon]
MGKQKGLIRWSSELSKKTLEFTQPEIMMKLIATVDDRGWPHLTVITSNRAVSQNTIVFGEFSKGLSKKYTVENKKIGLIYMSAEMPFQVLNVKAEFSHTKTEGSDLENFNVSQLMRYMTYMNVYKAYYVNVVKVSQIRTLPLGGIASGLLKVLIGKGGAKTELEERRLNPLGYKLFNGAINPKFLAYIDPEDGYPMIIPIIQLQAADHNRLVFPPTALKLDLEKIPVDATVAVLGMNMSLANQVVKGPFKGFQKFRGVNLGIIEIEEIYNSSPPTPGIIYPEIYYRPKVEEFKY